MTTAFPEPYGIALRGNGTDNDFRPLYDKLPKGVSHITVGTRYPKQVIIRTTPTAKWENLTILGTIPAGEGYRSITVTHSVGTGEDSYLIVSTAGLAEATARASATVVTIPLKGAGG